MIIRLLFPGVRHGQGHRVERERAQQIAAHALFDLDEGARGAVDPLHGQAFGQALEIGGEIDVADERRCARDDQKQILKQASESAQQIHRLLLAFGAGTIGFGGVEELGIIRLAQSRAQDDERVSAAQEIGIEVDRKRAADSTHRKSCGERAVARAQLGTASSQQRFEIGGRNCGEAMHHGARANRGQ